MQTTKKLVLVDEFDREYKRLQRPAAAVAKTDHSLRLSDTLCNASLADDRKVRRSRKRLPKSTGPPNPRKRRRRGRVEACNDNGTSIEAVYTNPRAPGSFGGVDIILKRYAGSSERETKKFLSGRDAYTLHKPRRIRFPRRKTTLKALQTCIRSIWWMSRDFPHSTTACGTYSPA